MRLRKNTIGFALAEALVALAVGGTFLTSVLTIWATTAKQWSQQGGDAKLHYSMETVIERMKYDIRLADGNNILFYPVGETTYTAISLPSPTRDANGFLTFNATGGIKWDRTVVYHVFKNASNQYELRMTVIPAFNTNAAQRQSELDAIAVNGNNGNSGTTRALLKAQTVTLAMTPQSPEFDGYAGAIARSDNLVFGSLRLTPGNHTIRFQATGKNALSSGMKIGLDQISLSPSGAPLEVEAMATVTNGKSQSLEDMSPFGTNIWGGNYQLEYGSSAPGDFVEFTTNYDRWMESNFADMTFQNTAVVNTNPAISVLSRENAALSPAWQATAQTGAALDADLLVTSDHTYRSVVQGADIAKGSTMMRIKFTAADAAHLSITGAYFGERSTTANKGMNFASAPTQLYFDNAAVANSTVDGVGAVGAGVATAKDIPAGAHVWSNWFTYSLDNTKDYIVSYHVANASNSGVTSWTDTPNIHSYEIHDSTAVDYSASSADLTAIPGLITDSNDYVPAVAEISAWTNSGVVTSQVYDTKITNPSFSQLAWSAALPNNSSILMKVRGGSLSDLSDAPAWTAVGGGNSSPMNIASLNGSRYVQFQATLTMGNPYTAYPTLDDVDMTWPGQTSLVEIAGYITKRPTYGKFKVLVDNKSPVNALKVDLSAQDTLRGKSYAYAMATQVNPKNTGK